MDKKITSSQKNHRDFIREILLLCYSFDVFAMYFVIMITSRQLILPSSRGIVRINSRAFCIRSPVYDIKAYLQMVF